MPAVESPCQESNGGQPVTGDDHHSGYYQIILGNVVTIAQYKQMVVFGTLILDGQLLIDGQLISEP